MTVKELIKELEKANQTAEVIIINDCHYEKDLIRVEVVDKNFVILVEC